MSIVSALYPTLCGASFGAANMSAYRTSLTATVASDKKQLAINAT